MRRLPLAAALCLCLNTLVHAADRPVTIPDADIEQLLSAYALVKARYVEPVDDRKLLGAAIDGMLASLDPHSQYLDKDELAELEQGHRGEYAGIGIEAEFDGPDMVVVSVSEGGPADLAGIEPGDVIVNVDGEPVAGLRSRQVAKRMRSTAGSRLALGVRRGAKGALRSIGLTRATVQAETVRMREAAPGVAWIRVSQFEEKTAADLVALLHQLDGQGAPRAIVLDLRNDPGGLVSAAVGVAGVFLPPDAVVFSARGATGATTSTVTVNPRFHRAAGEPDILAALPAWTRTVPLAVLVNGSSVSSAELVAGALQDHGRARVVGSQTFGKGSIQTVFPLPHDSAIKMTVARYFTPNGHEIQAKGITPDLPVAPNRGAKDADMPLLREADLARHLEATQDATSPAGARARRGTLESTRSFGTGDDRALAAAVRLLTPGKGLVSDAGALLRKLRIR
ncbi:S41 family peptidase [Massilia niastensis]|uniref:S41 family peptidase n=1 Tax=Massilia niastensis TaxID=544911 RepID=UPI00036C9C55|nr:S41 family peptidase [Massilia niastensis]